ncbi:MAG: phosphatase PAP2 family protein [Chloroflexi bacterium]|nr:phosphatase PAP2 family protein [Chloroflexota bacterium]
MNPFDKGILLWLNGLAGNTPVLDGFMRLFASDFLVPMLGVLSLVGLWFAGRTPAQRERFQITLFAGAAAVGFANLAVVIVNLIWERPRPFNAMPEQVNLLFYPSTDPSFPANPAAVGFAAATAVCLASKKLGLLLAIAATTQAVARVYVGVFYPTDVIGGAVVGMAIVALPFALRRLLRPLPDIAIRAARAVLLA